MTSITETTMTKNRVDAMEEGQSDARPIISSERPGLSSASRIVRPTSGPFQGWHDEIEAELRYKGAVEGAAGPSDQTVDEKFHMRINGWVHVVLSAHLRILDQHVRAMAHPRRAGL